MDTVRDRLLTMIEACPNLDFLLLTKRPENVAPTLAKLGRVLPSNVWLGVSVENQEQADARIPILLSIPTAVRFLSVEPMLGPINLAVDETVFWCNACGAVTAGVNGGDCAACGDVRTRERCYLDYLDWVIVGGESGPGARPMDEAWVRSLRDQCGQADVSYFYKQRVDGGRKVETPELDGRRWTQYPAPAVEVAR